MKHLFFIILLWLPALMATAQAGYDVTAERAARSFEWKEWNSAAAMYELMLRERPDSLSSYTRAVAANQMLGNDEQAIDLVERAMAHGIGLSELLEQVRLTDFALGEGDRYGALLHRLTEAMPWMRRALDNELLRYYCFRDDGPNIVRYAKVMLAGLPESTEYLSLLARGYMLQGLDAEAADTWRKILAIDPDNYDTLLYLGNYCRMQGNDTEAEALLRRAAAIRRTPYLESLLNSKK